jgi:hypothetical protein
VRCGRCNEVFNAIEALFDTDAAAPAAAGTAPTTRPGHTPPAPSAPASSSFESTQAQESIVPPGEADYDLVSASASPPDAAPAAGLSADLARHESPAFVRRANRAAAWNRPPVRLALLGAAGLLCAVLVAQTALIYRDPVAAHWPGARPMLDTACEWAGCRVEPLRRITALAVDASGLSPFEGGGGYRLSVVLRNRGDVELMLPAFDLLLSDTQGRTLARRVLTASELGASTPTLAAGAELALLGGLAVGERRVSGYTIEIFYP